MEDTHDVHMSEGQGKEAPRALDIEAHLQNLEAVGEEGISKPTVKADIHFRHAKQVISDIKAIARPALVGPCKYDLRARYERRLMLTTSIVKYQYQSYLLDPFLEEMVSPLITPIRQLVLDVTIGEHKGQQPNEQADEIFHTLNYIIKTRGYKTVVKFLPHEVADLEPAFEFLKMQTKRSPWETRYVMFIWLSLMCMIPFDLKSIDSRASKDSSRIPLVDEMIETGKHYLDCAGKDREGATLFLARLLTRKDTCKTYLPEFVTWSKDLMAKEPNVFHSLGIMGTFCWIFKLGQREVLLPIAEDLEELLVFIESQDRFMSNSSIKKYIVKLSQRVGLCLLKPRVAAWRYQRGSRSLRGNLAPKDTSAAAGAAGGIHDDKMSKMIAEGTEDDENFEVPEAIEGVIERLMNGLRDRDTIVRWSAAKGMGRISNRLPKDMADDVVGGIFELFFEDVFEHPTTGEPDISAVSEHTWHGACLAIAELSRRGLLLPHRLTELIPWIIKALKFDIKRGAHSVGSNVRDASCYVCWSFARAYTPEILDAHVRKLSNTLISVSVFDRDINIRRASSAAFQENVGRMGIFPHGIDIVTIADYFSIGNITNSYLTVAPTIAEFNEYRQSLSEHLMEASIPHWDIAVREVASESMARIAVLDIDYACNEIVPKLTAMTASLDPAVRHGALIALGRTCKALKAHSEQPLEQRLSPDTLRSLSLVVPSVPEFALTGFGSENVRQALCVFIASLSEASWKVEPSIVESWKVIVNSTLERSEEPLQRIGADTFRALVLEYGISETEVDQCLVKIEPKADRFGVQGFALALGEIDFKNETYEPWLPKVLSDLARTSDKNQTLDAESRRNAVNAVSNIIRVLGLSYKKVVSLEVSRNILQMYLSGLEDYSIDHRGDVGSWIREACMQGLAAMLPLVGQLDRAMSSVGKSNHYLSEENQVEVVSKLMQQSVEKIDKIRASAAAAIIKIIYARKDPEAAMTMMNTEESTVSEQDYAVHVPHRMDLMKVFEDSVELNWLQASEVYVHMVNLLHLPEYRSDLILGFIISAGGMTETLVRHASSCLTEFVLNLPISRNEMEVDDEAINEQQKEQQEQQQSKESLTLVEFGNTLVSLAEKYEGQDRVVLPFLEVMDLLMDSGSLLMMEDEFDFLPLVRFVRRQSQKSKDTRKISACIRLFCGFCSLGGKIRNAMLQDLLRLLVHSFPKIRRATADAMYLMLNSSADEPNEDMEQVGELLMNTDWNKPAPQVGPVRDKMYPLLGLEKPKFVKPSAAAAAARK
ncbi:hypothetical protein BG004_004976 [Podila humilis]|nr:hypothetical protein BG004_004976 [Podila humilis]